tara:strand:+ start:414 stop:1250 length:837 start_codon:yes stop_codon:yes gene_type:complete
MQNIVDQIIASIEAGTAPWQKPWTERGVRATNLATGKQYEGLNSLWLDICSAQFGCNYWGGYQQLKKLGGQVRKGEKGTEILAPMVRKGENKKTGEEYTYISSFKTIKIFNAAQCDGLTVIVEGENEPKELNANKLDSFLANTGADIRYGGDRAYYSPSSDHIQLPEINQFHSENGYYGTALHELIHWTGHKTRLDRLQDKSSKGYAFEELIAEIGAYYASIELDCPNEAENHASYIGTWLKELQNEPKYILQAAAQAEKATKFLLDLSKEHQQFKAA